MLTGKDESTTILFHALRKDFEILAVIQECPKPRSKFIMRRIQKLGIVTVIGQILFKFCIVLPLQNNARPRRKKIIRQFNLDVSPIKGVPLVEVHSVNAPETIEALRRLNPSIVLVNGTRIIASQVLECIPARFINTHAGITPLYRGAHGAYWALVDGKPDACGVTIHYVDSGIDTGDILAQGIITPTAEDCFVTYPLLQLATVIPLLKEALCNVADDITTSMPTPQGPSKLFSHPTIWQYLHNLVKRGVR
jgi:methionyl-tRNA formyltransferase